MDGDLEIQAMSAVAAALGPLEPDARGRIINWAAQRFGALPTVLGTNTSRATPAQAVATESTAFEGFAELFAAAEPKTDKEKTLVAAYWVQNCENQPNFAAQALNTILKDLGHGVGHITDALDALKDDKPALILQLKKSGTSKQARKTYKLTQEGAKRVQQMIRKEAV